MVESLPLVCGECGAKGRYNVGSIVLDTTVATPADPEGIEEAVGFTAYFRCRKCDAGGPWKLPDDTEMFIKVMALGLVSGVEDVPLVLGRNQTFDKKPVRYATEAEDHLQKLIDREPDRAFLWVRLGNVYKHGGQPGRAREAYQRALELDGKDIEAHAMMGDMLAVTGRNMEAVPHWHAVLEHARESRHIDEEFRRTLVRGAIECLLNAYVESNGKIDLLPTVNPEELPKRSPHGDGVLELCEFDLSSEEDVEELCDIYLGRPRRRGLGLFGRKKKQSRRGSADWPAPPMPHRRETVSVGRNHPCPCGSGRKYKKCCGR